jgi:Domain of unknown function (DUF4307)
MVPRPCAGGSRNGAHNRQVSDVAERLRRRYPPPLLPRPLLVVVIGIGAAIALSWLVWAALFHSRPAVAAQVSAFSVVSDTAIDVTLTVDRRDAAQPVTCLVVAQAADLSTVGEQEVAVAAATARVVDQKLTLVTLRRAATATAKGCTVD